MARNISTINIAASPEKVWKTLTAPELVKRWQYGSELITDWQPGHELRFRIEWDGKVYEQWGKVIEFNEPARLSYTLFAPRPELEDKPENYFIMHYVLTPEAGSTKLEIIQEDNRPGAVQEEPKGEESEILQTLKKLAEETGL